jgi:hypothetical protein
MVASFRSSEVLSDSPSLCESSREKFAEEATLERVGVLLERDAGTFESSVSNWQPGDEFRGAENRRYPITAVIPLLLVEEFVERPLSGDLEVEPL